MRAAAVNPADTLIRAGDVRFYDNHPRPIVPGMDASGVVDEIGPDTKTDFVVGDHVMAIVFPPDPTGGAYAEYLVLPAHRVIRAPSGTTYAAAATFGMNGLTARHALDSLRLPKGSTVAVTGAAGAVGSFVVSLAKRDGYRVIADARPADEELVRSCGADMVVARGDDVADRILAAAPSGVDGVLDTALMGSVLLPAIRDGGSMIPFRAIGERGMSGPSPTTGYESRSPMCASITTSATSSKRFAHWPIAACSKPVSPRSSRPIRPRTRTGCSRRAGRGAVPSSNSDHALEPVGYATRD